MASLEPRSNFYPRTHKGLALCTEHCIALRRWHRDILVASTPVFEAGATLDNFSMVCPKKSPMQRRTWSQLAVLDTNLNSIEKQAIVVGDGAWLPMCFELFWAHISIQLHCPTESLVIWLLRSSGLSASSKG